MYVEGWIQSSGFFYLYFVFLIAFFSLVEIRNIPNSSVCDLKFRKKSALWKSRQSHGKIFTSYLAQKENLEKRF